MLGINFDRCVADVSLILWWLLDVVLRLSANLEYYDKTVLLFLFTFMIGTCESFFCVRIESRIESAVRFDFESNFRIESAVYTTQAVKPSNELQGAPCMRTVYGV